MKDFDIKEQVKKLPETPGVYLMHNEVDEIIYVGKAVNLKARVSQYFHHNDTRTKRVLQMIASIDWFEYRQTKTELEALVLESNLIKQYRPRYNVILRDDENHPYLKVDWNDPYPKISITTENRREDSFRYIGPFYKSMDLEEILDFLSKYYGLRTCNKDFLAKKIDRHPCMYDSLGMCMAPCKGNVDTENYKEQVRTAMHFFRNPDWSEIKETISKKMSDAAAKLAFEKAIKYKEMLAGIEMYEKRLAFPKEMKSVTDLFAIASNEEMAIILLYMIRNNNLSGRDLFYVEKRDNNQTNAEILRQFLYAFYEGNPYLPEQILLPDRISNQSKFGKSLSEKKGSKVKCQVPRTGENGRLLELARESAEQLLIQNKMGDTL